MRLIEYLNLYNGLVSFDTEDKDIEGVVTVCYDKESRIPDGRTEELQYKCEEELYSKVNVVGLFGAGTPVCDWSEFIRRNKWLVKRFIRKNWDNSLQSITDDDADLCYEVIRDLDCLVAGNYGRSALEEYYELLRKCV